MNENGTTYRTDARGIAYALLSAVAFGTLVPFCKLLLGELAPLHLAALMLTAAGVAAGVLLMVRRALTSSPQERPLAKSDAPKLGAMIALNAAAIGCLACGIAHTLAVNASLLMGFEIAAATVFGWALFHRHVCYKAIAAVGLMLAASILLCWNVAGPIAFVPESLLIVAACALRGLESGLKRSLADKDPVQIACIRSLGAGIALLAVSFAVDGLPTAPMGYMGGALALGCVTFGLGAILHLSAQRRLGSARSESYFALAPFVGTIVSWGYFGFELEPLFFGAFALMALGMWLAMDDSVFHEDVFAAFNQERMALYTGEVSALDFDRLHRPLNQ